MMLESELLKLKVGWKSKRFPDPAVGDIILNGWISGAEGLI